MPSWRRNRLRRSQIRRRRAELEKIAQVCRHVPAHAPSDFHEALQYYWFVHLGVTTELNTWDAFCPGKLDQHLLPFYDLNKNGREYYEELLHCFWIKFNNQPAPPKVGVTAAESGTYTDFAQINVGGLAPRWLGWRQRGFVSAVGCDRGYAPAPAVIVGAGQQEEPR